MIAGLEVVEQGGARRKALPIRGSHGDEHSAAAAVPGPRRRGLRHARELRGEVCVVLQRHDAAEGEHRSGSVDPGVLHCLPVLRAACRQGIDRGLEAERLRQRERDLLGPRGAGKAESGAIGGDDVVDAGRQPGARDPVAERDRGGPGVVDDRRVHPVARARAEQDRHLVPEDAVDPHLERRLAARRRRRLHVRHRLLAKHEALEGPSAVTAAEHLAGHAFAVGGVGHVAEQVDRRPALQVVHVRQRLDEEECADGRGGAGLDRGHLADDLVVRARWDVSHRVGRTEDRDVVARSSVAAPTGGVRTGRSRCRPTRRWASGRRPGSRRRRDSRDPAPRAPARPARAAVVVRALRGSPVRAGSNPPRAAR